MQAAACMQTCMYVCTWRCGDSLREEEERPHVHIYIYMQVVRVVVVPDEVDAIAAALSALLRGGVDVVLSAGGIGPTLDDVTMEGISAALDMPLRRYACACTCACTHARGAHTCMHTRMHACCPLHGWIQPCMHARMPCNRAPPC